MTDQSSIHLGSKSISQLVQELNQLGDANVAMHPITLIAIHEKDQSSVRRFRSKSTSRNQTISKAETPNLSQFFLTDHSNKKYHYNEISNELEIITIGNIMGYFQRGFNVSIILQHNLSRLFEILDKIKPWFEDMSGNSSIIASFTQYKTKDMIDLFSTDHKSAVTSLQQPAETVFYPIEFEELVKEITSTSVKNIRILKLRNHQQTNSETRIILFPEEFMNPNLDPSLKIIKNQLIQIFNYIKTNPNKRYENLNKLLPKRHPVTSIIAQLILYDSANFIINWVNDNEGLNGRFDLFDKFIGISNFIKKVENEGNFKIVERKKINPRKSFKSPGTKKQEKTSNSTKPMGFNYETQLEYCRSLERKTHKYSISEFSSENQLFEKNLQNETDPNFAKCSESEAITILKSQHAREISQYHQTIQNLNKKILALTSEKGIEEIYTIHEREIMMLELKIEELRNDLSKICDQKKIGKGNELGNLKAMIKKLNDEIKIHEKSSNMYKLSQGKIKMQEKQLTELKNKFKQSQVARLELSKELDALTKRLKIKDQEAIEIQKEIPSKYEENDLAAKDKDELKDIVEILEKITTNKDSRNFLIRRIRDILGDLSATRQIVLECNNFLVSLQEHIESRLSEKDPDVVLDCNRFIRGYLLNNLNIF